MEIFRTIDCVTVFVLFICHASLARTCVVCMRRTIGDIAPTLIPHACVRGRLETKTNRHTRTGQGTADHKPTPNTNIHFTIGIFAPPTNDPSCRAAHMHTAYLLLGFTHTTNAHTHSLTRCTSSTNKARRRWRSHQVCACVRVT